MTQVLSTNEELTELAAKLLKDSVANRSWTMDDEIVHIQIHGKRSIWGEARWAYVNQRWATLWNEKRRSKVWQAQLQQIEEQIEKLKVQYATDF
jgi:hypothetical protein